MGNSAQTYAPYNQGANMTLSYMALLAFMFGVLFNPSVLFPLLRPLHVQEIFATIAMVGFFGQCLNRLYTINLSTIVVMFSLFIVWSAVGYINAANYGNPADWHTQFVIVLKSWVIFVVLATFMSTPELFQRGFNFFMWCVFLFQLHGLKAVAAGTAFNHGRFDSYVGQIGNSDALGAFFVSMLPIQLELYLYYKSGWRRRCMLFSALTSIFLVVLTQTRSAFLSLIIVLLIWLFGRTNTSRRKKMVMLSVLSGVLLATGIFMAKTSDYSNYFERMKSIFISETLQDDTNVKSRFLFWEQGIEIWKKFPIIGSGIGNMGPHATLIEEDEAAAAYMEFTSIDEYSLHQSFIQVLAERGSIGFILYVYFIYALLRSLKRGKYYLDHYKGYEYYSYVSSGLRLSLIVFVINAQFMTVTTSWHLVILAGFVAALDKIVIQLVQHETPHPS